MYAGVYPVRNLNLCCIAHFRPQKDLLIILFGWKLHDRKNSKETFIPKASNGV